jgi:ATP-dependent Clp protease ATP-binding subunit ClpB
MDLKLTTRSQEAMAAAIRRAATDGHPQVGPAHLLAALVEQPDGVAPALLRAAGADLRSLISAVDVVLKQQPAVSGSSVSSPSLGRTTYQALSAAGDLARELDDEYVSTEHLLIGLASVAKDDATLAPLTEAGITRQKLLDVLPSVRGGARVTSPDPEGTFQALEKYGLDLTAQAREGKLDPVIGRDQEIRRPPTTGPDGVPILSHRTTTHRAKP